MNKLMIDERAYFESVVLNFGTIEEKNLGNKLREFLKDYLSCVERLAQPNKESNNG